MKKKFFKNTKGITLIALVVTIIVLLILAGITLSLALNSNGVFQRSKNAAAAYSEAELAEREELDRIGEEFDEVMGIFPPLEIPEELEEGAEIIYKPEGTFHWDAELASSYANDGSTTYGIASDVGLDASTSDYDVIDMQLATGEEIPTGSENMNIKKWRVVSLNKETGEAVIVPTASTLKIDGVQSGYVVLQGAQGYNNAVKLLNDACSALYGNPKKGITARSISMEDIEPLLNATALETAKNNYTPSYGNRHTTESSGYRDSEGSYTTLNKFFPAIYASEKNSIVNGILNSNGLGLSKQNSYITRTGSVKVGSNTYTATNGFVKPTSIRPEQTYYYMNAETFATALGDKNKEIILPKGEQTVYWVASRCVRVYDGYCYFFVRYVDGGRLNYNSMYYSDGYGDHRGLAGLFPVVTLKSGVISGDGAEGYVFSLN